MQTLRDYQDAALTSILFAWEKGERPLLELATGLGKTTVIAELLRRECNPATQRALVVIPSLRIMRQMFERIDQQFEGRLTKEVYGVNWDTGLTVVGGGDTGHRGRIVVATYQSCKPASLKKMLAAGMFDFLLIDESHHALDANTYGKVYRALSNVNPFLKILGVTATPQRSDKKALGSIFTSICYSYRYPEALAAGYLAPITRIKVKTGVDVSKVVSTAGDYNEKKLVGILDTANWTDLAVQAFRDYVAGTGRPCLAYFPTVKQSKAFAAAMLTAGYPCAHTDGETEESERSRQIAALENKELLCISSVGVYIEGADVPCVGALLFARPTRSKTVFTQIVGRAVRLFPGKRDCLMVDLTVNDTKGLEVGTLLGDTRECKGCGAHYFTSFQACPRCGLVYVPPPPPSKECPGCGSNVPLASKECPSCGWNFALGGKFLPVVVAGKGLHVEKASAFAALEDALSERRKEGKCVEWWGAWFTDERGYQSLQWSFEDPVYLLSTADSSGLHHLMLVHPKDKSNPKWLASHIDPEVLKAYADGRARVEAPPQFSRTASWKGQPASEGQLKWARELGLQGLEGATKGDLSQRITHHQVMQKVSVLHV